MRMQLQNSEQGRHNKNHSTERAVGFLAQLWRKRMAKDLISKQLWGFGLVYEAEPVSIMSINKDKRNGYEEVTGQTP